MLPEKKVAMVPAYRENGSKKLVRSRGIFGINTTSRQMRKELPLLSKAELRERYPCNLM